MEQGMEIRFVPIILATKIWNRPMEQGMEIRFVLIMLAKKIWNGKKKESTCSVSKSGTGMLLDSVLWVQYQISSLPGISASSTGRRATPIKIAQAIIPSDKTVTCKNVGCLCNFVIFRANLLTVRNVAKINDLDLLLFCLIKIILIPYSINIWFSKLKLI